MDVQAINKALELAKLGIASYPTRDKKPLTPHGQYDATTEPEELKRLFKHPSDINIRLNTSRLIVLDVDRHTEGKNGTEALYKLAEQHGNFFSETYFESTPHNGLHFFFKTNAKQLRDKTDLDNGLEIIADQIVIAPSRGYESAKHMSFKDIKEAPTWLVDMAKVVPSHSAENSAQYNGIKRYGAYLLEEMAQGATTGQRNTYLTKMIGKMLYQGTAPKVVYEFACIANQHFVNPTLSDKELNRIFKSVLQRETKRLKGVSV
ncbi:bifunctional DNA primase/polymerase [Pediococcus pentosaceus]|uniref:bifunctional DNA primase/polymerase n=1 Tax=Pediococcus pentosaceus TaxID=1255 RepID=UPI0021E72214|nr:bifunctional DNA primase/polymerase [Pediococcus pentosaceus]MCV3320481.1 bifunctional DNA primase/polymerase [Pediococcus pentosaceus]